MCTSAARAIHQPAPRLGLKPRSYHEWLGARPPDRCSNGSSESLERRAARTPASEGRAALGRCQPRNAAARCSRFCSWLLTRSGKDSRDRAAGLVFRGTRVGRPVAFIAFGRGHGSGLRDGCGGAVRGRHRRRRRGLAGRAVVAGRQIVDPVPDQSCPDRIGVLVSLVERCPAGRFGRPCAGAASNTLGICGPNIGGVPACHSRSSGKIAGVSPLSRAPLRFYTA
jgi:hypothetical protein